MPGSKQIKDITFQNRLLRAIWHIAWLFLYRPTPRNLHGFRRFLLRLFGANIGTGAHPYPAARIYAPWNLTMGANSCLSDHVDCYCVDKVILGEGALVSQYSYLCTATHDYTKRDFPTLTAPIHIEANAWVAADVFVGPGITIGEGAVIGARSHVAEDVPAWQVFVGSPARFLKDREPLDD